MTAAELEKAALDTKEQEITPPETKKRKQTIDSSPGAGSSSNAEEAWFQRHSVIKGTKGPNYSLLPPFGVVKCKNPEREHEQWRRGVYYMKDENNQKVAKTVAICARCNGVDTDASGLIHVYDHDDDANVDHRAVRS